MKDPTEHYKQGQKARRHGKALTDNPYGHGHHHTEWNAGWMNEDRVIKGLTAPHNWGRYMKDGV